MLASFIGIDGYVERNIGRLVARQDGPAFIDQNFRCGAARAIIRFAEPSVIDRLRVLRQEARSAIAGGSATLDAFLFHITFDCPAPAFTVI